MLLRFVQTQLGHNLNYAHSNKAGMCNDQTGMMGYSYYSDDGPIMCFNGAKSWQTGWYTSKSKVISPGELVNEKLYGIVDFNNTASSFVLFKINYSCTTDLYVANNRASGINWVPRKPQIKSPSHHSSGG